LGGFHLGDLDGEWKKQKTEMKQARWKKKQIRNGMMQIHPNPVQPTNTEGRRRRRKMTPSTEPGTRQSSTTATTRIRSAGTEMEMETSEETTRIRSAGTLPVTQREGRELGGKEGKSGGRIYRQGISAIGERGRKVHGSRARPRELAKAAAAAPKSPARGRERAWPKNNEP
jgi:hypothetical protein